MANTRNAFIRGWRLAKYQYLRARAWYLRWRLGQIETWLRDYERDDLRLATFVRNFDTPGDTTHHLSGITGKSLCMEWRPSPHRRDVGYEPPTGMVRRWRPIVTDVEAK